MGDARPEQVNLKNMTEQEYSAFVKSRVKPGSDIASGMTAENADLLHGAVGLSGETGELLDAVKKHVVYNKPLDRENVIEELGDIEFYLEQIRQNIGVTRHECILANISKLSKRYSEGKYTDKQASERADKKSKTDPEKRVIAKPTAKRIRQAELDSIPASPKLHEVMSEIREAKRAVSHIYRTGDGLWIVPEGAEREGAKDVWSPALNALTTSIRGARYRWKRR